MSCLRLFREKRWPYDAGIHLPLVVRWPGQLEPGSVNDDLVAWVDLAPTILSLAHVEIPDRYQGQVFPGTDKAPPREYVYAGRDRMDEADPFMAETKPVEELYDAEADPENVHNLAGSPAYEPVLEEMPAALERWLAEVGDLGRVSEEELVERGLVTDRISEYRQRVAPLPDRYRLGREQAPVTLREV